MAKYAKYQRKSKRKTGTNPVWRGIGCNLIVVVPLMAYALMAILTPSVIASGLVPNELRGHVQFPDWVLHTPTLGSIAGYISGINNLWLKVIEFFVILALLAGIFSLAYTAVFQIVGPPRYTALDAPPPKHKPKAYKR
jgi:hypothetical protein